MLELQLMNIEQMQMTDADFENVKARLQCALAQYENKVYSDENIREAKDDRAKCNKAKKAFEDRRKGYKAECLQPYNEVEPKFKELVAMVDRLQGRIDESVKAYEERQRQAKEAEVRAYYNQKAAVLGNMAQELYPKLFDKRWLNATAKKKDVERGIVEAVTNAGRDIQEIREMGSPFVQTLLEIYLQTLSLDEVRAKDEELRESVRKAGVMEERREEVLRPAPLEAGCEEHTDGQRGTLLRVFAESWQMNQICDFMKAIGVRYEMEGEGQHHV